MKDLFTVHEELADKGYTISFITEDRLFYSNEEKTISVPVTGVDSEYDIDTNPIYIDNYMNAKLVKPNKFYKFQDEDGLTNYAYPFLLYEGEEYLLSISSDFSILKKSDYECEEITDLSPIKQELLDILDGNIPFIMTEDGDICINTFFGSIKYNDYTLEIWCDTKQSNGYEVDSVLPEIASTLYSAYLPIVLQDEELKSRLNELIIP